MSDQLFLKNYMEECTWEFLDEVLSKYPEVCNCESCRYDIAAITLNSLPARYVVREKGEIYSKASMLRVQYRADIYAALTKAIFVVKDQPRHNQRQESSS